MNIIIALKATSQAFVNNKYNQLTGNNIDLRVTKLLTILADFHENFVIWKENTYVKYSRNKDYTTH